MALSAVLDTTEFDSLAEILKTEYRKSEADGKYYLVVDGLEDVSALRANNQKLVEEKRKLQEKYKAFENIDPAKAAEALDKLRKIEEKQLLDSGEVEKVIENRTTLMKKDHEGRIEAMTTASKKLEEDNKKLLVQLNEAVVVRGIQDAVNSVGQPRKEALEDIISRGMRTWQLGDDSKPIPRDSAGNIMYGKDGKAPMTMHEWAQSLMESAPHLWTEPKGGGARGSNTMLGNKQYADADLDKLSPTAKAQLFRSGQLKK